MQEEQALDTGLGVTLPRGVLKAKPSHQRRGQSLPAYTYCEWQHCSFPAVSCEVFCLKSVEVPLLQVLMFCKALTDFAMNMGLDVLEVATLN